MSPSQWWVRTGGWLCRGAMEHTGITNPPSAEQTVESCMHALINLMLHHHDSTASKRLDRIQLSEIVGPTEQFFHPFVIHLWIWNSTGGCVSEYRIVFPEDSGSSNLKQLCVESEHNELSFDEEENFDIRDEPERFIRILVDASSSA